MKQILVIDLKDCNLCMSCLEICPLVFTENDGGEIPVEELAEDPQAEVEETMVNCPKHCISWE